MCARKKLIAGICDATVFLSRMGLLNHVMHTSNDLQDLLDFAQEEYTGQNLYLHRQCVRDGNVITANGSATLEFAKAILAYLEVADNAELNEWFCFYKNGLYSTDAMHF